MKLYKVSFPPSLWTAAKEKADTNLMSLAAVIRRLVELWLNDKIKLN